MLLAIETWRLSSNVAEYRGRVQWECWTNWAHWSAKGHAFLYSW